MFNDKLVRDFFTKNFVRQGINRELKINHKLNKLNKIISIIGPRRSGKTWYLMHLSKSLEKPMYVNFEDVAFRRLSIEEFFDIIEIFAEINYTPKTLLLDEIQTIDEWNILVRSLYDRGFKIILTGSSSKLLGKEVSTALRGRTINYLLLPFSFREFLKAKNVKLKKHLNLEDRGMILNHLREYLNYGGFPEIVISDDNYTKEQLLKSYFDEIFYKDFVERHKIKSLDFGRFLFEFAFQNFSSEISGRKIKNFFGKRVSDTTLYEYLEKLQDTLAIMFLNKFSKNIYLRNSWPRKLYVVDLGISTVLGLDFEIGKRMENVVFLELLRRRNKHPLRNLFFLKDENYEIDFVVTEKNKVIELINVSYITSKKDIKEREIKGLVKASEKFKEAKLVLITWMVEDKLIIENKEIQLVPLWKFLLKQ